MSLRSEVFICNVWQLWKKRKELWGIRPSSPLEEVPVAAIVVSLHTFKEKKEVYSNRTNAPSLHFTLFGYPLWHNHHIIWLEPLAAWFESRTAKKELHSKFQQIDTFAYILQLFATYVCFEPFEYATTCAPSIRSCRQSSDHHALLSIDYISIHQPHLTFAFDRHPSIWHENQPAAKHKCQRKSFGLGFCL